MTSQIDVEHRPIDARPRRSRAIGPAAVVARLVAAGVAPTLFAVVVFAAGAMLLVSGATPAEPDRLRALRRLASLGVIEASHFLSGLVGAGLLLLGWGIVRRIDAAWTAAVSLLVLGAALALAKGWSWEEAVVLGGLALAMLPFRSAFYRHSAALGGRRSAAWTAAAFIAFIGSVAIGLGSYEASPFDIDVLGRFSLQGDASRFARTSAGVAAVLLLFMLWLALRPPPSSVLAFDQLDRSRIRTIVETAERPTPDAWLAFVGDKSFHFSASGATFLMFAVRGRSWVTMGGPVGRSGDVVDTMWSFLERADEARARAVFYGIGPEALPACVDLGLAVQKVGERALVPLADFSLQGRRKQDLRTSRNRFARLGATLQVYLPGGGAPDFQALRTVSDGWLARHAGEEKGFSVGRFDPDYLRETPLAVLMLDGKATAFANLTPTRDRSRIGVDLMRYAPDAPAGVMDHLMTELIFWAKAQGYAAFDLSMAPLAGLDVRARAPLVSLLGGLVYEYGEALYNFQGVRAFKEKFQPVWEPVYIAVPGRAAVGAALLDSAMLTAGGLAGALRRGA